MIKVKGKQKKRKRKERDFVRVFQRTSLKKWSSDIPLPPKKKKRLLTYSVCFPGCTQMKSRFKYFTPAGGMAARQSSEEQQKDAPDL